jgi:hypothetical protein
MTMGMRRRSLLFAASLVWMAAAPVGPARGGPVGTAPPADALDREVARGDELEHQIQEELRRQKELLQMMEAGQSAPPEPEPGPDPERLAERSDPRIAPRAPAERDLPRAIFEEERVVVAKGTWGNDRRLEVFRRRLDADRDGRPEEIRYVDRRSESLLRVERDRDYDGVLDAWQTYEDGQLVSRVLDDDNDGRPDTWEEYAQGRMTSRAIDRDGDGVKDAFYRYLIDSLVEETHDTDNDGRIDLRIVYKNRQRTRAEEDSDRDGRMDTWTTYRMANGSEVVARIERDSKGRGKPDVFETFDARGGKAVLSRREEDVDGDGTVDVTSIYENGKLVRREISDPSLMPL